MRQRSRTALPKTTRSSDADEVARRRERARSARYVIRNLQPECPIFSNFEVLSDSGKTYEVEIRDLAWKQVFCTCVDFRINQLGTCKHVEAVLEHLEQKASSAYARAIERSSSRIDIVPGEAPGSLIVERGVEQLAAPLRRMISAEGEVDAVLSADFLAACKAKEPRARISLELREKVAHQVQQRERLEIRREYEASVRRGEAPASETLVPLYPYQREGMLHLAFQERAIIADEFGLERVPQAIGACLLLRRLGKVQRVLVITSSSLIPLWESEIAEYAGMPNFVVEGTVRRRVAAYQHGSFFTVVRFEDAVADIETINAVLKPDVVILDEAQRIRDWHSPTAMRIKQLESRYGFVLTSGELSDAPDEIYSVMSFVNPTVLGPLFRFNRDYYIFDAEGKLTDVQNLDRLWGKIRPYLLRRTRMEVASQIPKRAEKTYFVPLSRYQRELYSRHEANVQALLKLGKTKPSAKQREDLMREMGVLRMICDSPAVIGDKESGSGKLSEIKTILHECLRRRGQKIVVFSEWERMLQLVEEICTGIGTGTAWIKGSLSGAQRRKEIERFNTDETCRVLLGTDAVASGVQMKGTGVLINCDIPWSAEKLEHRITRVQFADPLYPLNVIHLVASDTVEQKIFSRWTRDAAKRGQRVEKVSQAGKFPKLGPVEEIFDLPQAQTPSIPESRRADAAKVAMEAARKLKLARILKMEDFREESAVALGDALLITVKALATLMGLPLPEKTEDVTKEPYSKYLDRYALSIWKWSKEPVDFLDSGLEAVSGLLASSGWKDARGFAILKSNPDESALSH